MEMQKIRQFRLADPFKPFELVLDDGRKLPVDKPYYLAISPDDVMLVHASLNGGFERLRPESVRAIDLMDASGSAA